MDYFVLALGVAEGWCLRGAWYYLWTPRATEQRLTDDVSTIPASTLLTGSELMKLKSVVAAVMLTLSPLLLCLACFRVNSIQITLYENVTLKKVDRLTGSRMAVREYKANLRICNPDSDPLHLLPTCNN